MKKFEIYQNNKLAPSTVVVADSWQFRGEHLEFFNNHIIIAVFNFNNITGFEQILEF